MKKIRVGLVLIALAWATLGHPAAAFGEVEVTGVFGGLVGGDLNNVLAGNLSIEGAIENGPLFGIRVGWIRRFLGVEGSFVGSPSGLSLSVPGAPIGVNGKVLYLEANLLLVPIPGPVSPFFTVGGGLHSYSFDVGVAGATAPLADLRKPGFNFGGGLKINISALTLRAEVRDHVTTIGPGDFGLETLAADLGFDGDDKLHNIEIAAGVGIRF